LSTRFGPQVGSQTDKIPMRKDETHVALFKRTHPTGGNKL